MTTVASSLARTGSSSTCSSWWPHKPPRQRTPHLRTSMLELDPRERFPRNSTFTATIHKHGGHRVRQTLDEATNEQRRKLLQLQAMQRKLDLMSRQFMTEAACVQRIEVLLRVHRERAALLVLQKRAVVRMQALCRGHAVRRRAREARRRRAAATVARGWLRHRRAAQLARALGVVWRLCLWRRYRRERAARDIQRVARGAAARRRALIGRVLAAVLKGTTDALIAEFLAIARSHAAAATLQRAWRRRRAAGAAAAAARRRGGAAKKAKKAKGGRRRRNSKSGPQRKRSADGSAAVAAAATDIFITQPATRAGGVLDDGDERSTTSLSTASFGGWQLSAEARSSFSGAAAAGPAAVAPRDREASAAIAAASVVVAPALTAPAVTAPPPYSFAAEPGVRAAAGITRVRIRRLSSGAAADDGNGGGGGGGSGGGDAGGAQPGVFRGRDGSAAADAAQPPVARGSHGSSGYVSDTGAASAGAMPAAAAFAATASPPSHAQGVVSAGLAAARWRSKAVSR
ncbi:hypothetical protein JKP88DRAFT_242144 [Tribonema minus]|uniref:Uncharacterized protein n=1 Tax=Tribonema minus TaxID=303371 RepID=A0A836C8X5_9STRA|nr:hypothetical protein JKP88DRAFT_242144 [Tribonema minus]